MADNDQWVEDYAEYAETFDLTLRDIVAKALACDPLIAGVASYELYPVEQILAASRAGWQLKFDPLMAASHFMYFAALADLRVKGGGKIGRYFRALTGLLPLKHGIGTRSQRHFSVFNFVRLEFFDGEPDRLEMQVFVEAFGKQLGVDMEQQSE